MWGQDHVRSPLEREAGSTGASEEQQQPCWARETKFTLSCSFKTIAGQGWGWIPPSLALELRHRSTGPARGGGHSTRAHCPWRGTRPSLKDKGIMLKAVLGAAGHGRLPCKGQWRRLRQGQATCPRARAAPQGHGRTRAQNWVRHTTGLQYLPLPITEDLLTR